MLYHSFVYSRLTYGITAWGTSAQNQLREIEVKLNNIIRTMIWNKKFSHVSQLYKSSQVKFISPHAQKSTQAGNSDKTMRSSWSTAPFSNTLQLQA